MIQLNLRYYNNLMASFMSVCSSRRQNEISVWPAPYKLTLLRKTFFKLRFEQSILSLLSCRSVLPIRPMIPEYYRNTKTKSHLENIAGIYFLSIECRIPSFLFLSKFFKLSFDVKSSKALFSVSNLTLNHSTLVNRIPYEL